MAQTIPQSDRTSTPTKDRSPEELCPARDLVNYAKKYARQKPDVAALWCFGIGFVLGWKVKPW